MGAIKFIANDVQSAIDKLGSVSDRIQDAHNILITASSYLDFKKVSISGVEGCLEAIAGLKTSVIGEKFSLTSDKASFEAAEGVNAQVGEGAIPDWLLALFPGLAGLEPGAEDGASSNGSNRWENVLGFLAGTTQEGGYGAPPGAKGEATEATEEKNKSNFFDSFLEALTGFTKHEGVDKDGNPYIYYSYKNTGKNGQKGSFKWTKTLDGMDRRKYNMVFDDNSNVILIEFGGGGKDCTRHTFTQTLQEGSAMFVATHKISDELSEEELEQKANDIYLYIQEAKERNPDMTDEEFLLVIGSFSAGGSVEAPVMEYLVQEYYTEGGSHYEDGNQIAGQVLVIDMENAAVDPEGENNNPQGRVDVSEERDVGLHEALDEAGVDYEHVKVTGLHKEEPVSVGSQLAAEQEAVDGVATWLQIPGGHSMMSDGLWKWFNPVVEAMAKDLILPDAMAEGDKIPDASANADQS